jgi:sugar/nucleoside kinase (ribokinase family)
MSPLEKLQTLNNTLDVWGEPTVCDIALCGTPFMKDGSVRGEITRCYGGSAYATAIGAARRGVDTVFYGPFGADREGVEALSYAQANGVLVKPLQSGVTRRTIIITDTDGTRSMVGDSGDAFLRPYADEIDGVRSGVFHLSLSSVDRDETGSIKRLVERSSCEILSLDLGSIGAIERVSADGVRQLLSAARFTVVFANAEEASCFKNTPGIDVSENFFIERSGGGGAFLRHFGEEWFEPAVSGVKPLDTTGAGDAFAAGFLSSLLKGERDPKNALRAGHIAAADVISRVGTV